MIFTSNSIEQKMFIFEHIIDIRAELARPGQYKRWRFIFHTDETKQGLNLYKEETGFEIVVSN